MTSSSPPPRRPSEVIREEFERIWKAWGGHLLAQGIERIRVQQRARMAAVEAYLDEDAKRRDERDREVRSRLDALERAARQPGRRA